MDTETLIYIVMIAIYIMVGVARRVAKKNIESIKTQPPSSGKQPVQAPDPYAFDPLAPNPYSKPNDAYQETDDYFPMSSSSSFEAARETFDSAEHEVFMPKNFEPIFADESVMLGSESSADADEQTLYPGYSYKPIDIPEPEPVVVAESPLRPVERRAESSAQPDEVEALHPVLADIQANGFDPIKAVLYAEIITPRHNIF